MEIVRQIPLAVATRGLPVVGGWEASTYASGGWLFSSGAIPTPAIVAAVPVSDAPADNFLGVPVATDVPSGKIYPMLMLGLREIDQAAGNTFLERFVKRPEQVWDALAQKIWKLPYLLDPVRIPESLLKYLRANVGFGPGSGLPDRIARRLGTTDLRKLIKLAVPYWTERGTRGALEASLRIVTGIRPAVYDWFWMRGILGEIELGIAGDQADWWLGYSSVLDVSAGVADGEVGVAIRVPDENGTLDHQVVLDLASLARPLSERYEIAFVDFLDTFVDGRLGHWISEGTDAVWQAGADGSPPVLPALRIVPGVTEIAVTPRCWNWTSYVWTMVLRPRTTPGAVNLYFYRSTTGIDHYRVTLTPPNTVDLYRRVLGVDTLLVTAAYVLPTTPFGARIDVVAASSVAPNQIRVYLDGDLALEHLADTSHHTGTIAVGCPAGGSDGWDFAQTELWEQPLTVELLTP